MFLGVTVLERIAEGRHQGGLELGDILAFAHDRYAPDASASYTNNAIPK
jgi:hypothetical protein